MPYAVAIFCDRKSLERFRREREGRDDYDRMRGEIGGSYFGGDSGFH